MHVNVIISAVLNGFGKLLGGLQVTFVGSRQF